MDKIPVIPVILVSDFEESPPVTMRYALRDNEIELKEVYVKVNKLCDHPGRGRLKAVGGGDEPGRCYRNVNELYRLRCQIYIFKLAVTSFASSLWSAAARSRITLRSSCMPIQLPCRAYGSIYWTSCRLLLYCPITGG